MNPSWIKSPAIYLCLDTNGENILNVNASKSMEDSLNDRGEDDDMDDNASRVSDITEDRTQRQIDDDLAERRKILLAYVNKTNIGGGHLSNASTQRRLETIENMLPRSESQDANNGGMGNSSSSQPRRLSVAE